MICLIYVVKKITHINDVISELKEVQGNLKLTREHEKHLTINCADLRATNNRDLLEFYKFGSHHSRTLFYQQSVPPKSAQAAAIGILRNWYA
jgi:hypothetical protein